MLHRALPCGDYGITLAGRLVAAVERKSLADLVSSLLNGTLRYALAELAALPRSAVVVEDRYSQVFKIDWVRSALVAGGLAELQVRWPGVPMVFAETRQLAEEWTCRYLAAAHTWAETEHAVAERFGIAIDSVETSNREPDRLAADRRGTRLGPLGRPRGARSRPPAPRGDAGLARRSRRSALW